jgi:hypothetical protein
MMVITPDLDRDGIFDLVVANHGSDSLSLRFGDEAGGFGDEYLLSTGRGPLSVGSADFDGDHHPDLISSGTPVVIHLADGRGGFDPAQPVFDTAEFLAPGDLDGNGTRDLVVVSVNQVTTLVGLGDGTFAPLDSQPVGLDPGFPASSITMGELNGDGFPDVVVTEFFRHGDISILFGNGDCTLREAEHYGVGPYSWPFSAVIDDFNRDGRPDIAASAPLGHPGYLAVLLNRGDFDPNQPEVLEVGIDVRPGDPNNLVPLKSSGILPVAVFGSEQVDVHLIDPISLRLAGAPVQRMGGFDTWMCREKDLNRDGRPDLLCKFLLAEMEIGPDATAVVLEGMISEYVLLRGEDAIQPIP